MTEEQRWPEPVYLTKDHALNMTLRDYAAIKAMQSLNSRADYSDSPADVIALDAYALADAMLKEREKK